jgi:hypothetical protein
VLDLEQLQQVCLKRCREVFDGVGGWTVLEWAGAANGASGKAMDLCRRMRLGEPVDPDEIMRELATSIIYQAILAAKINGHLDDAIREEFNRKSAELGVSFRL